MHVKSTHHLALTALCSDNLEIISAFTHLAKTCKCTIVKSRMTALGEEFVISMLLSGHWDAIAKIEAALPTLEEKLNTTINSYRTEITHSKKPLIPYVVQILTLEKPGVLDNCAQFFISYGIQIENVTTDTYLTHTQTQMALLKLHINFPEGLSIAAFREEFLHYCDEQHLDGDLEPLQAHYDL